MVADDAGDLTPVLLKAGAWCLAAVMTAALVPETPGLVIVGAGLWAADASLLDSLISEIWQQASPILLPDPVVLPPDPFPIDPNPVDPPPDPGPADPGLNPGGPAPGPGPDPGGEPGGGAAGDNGGGDVGGGGGGVQPVEQ